MFCPGDDVEIRLWEFATPACDFILFSQQTNFSVLAKYEIGLIQTHCFSFYFLLPFEIFICFFSNWNEVREKLCTGVIFFKSEKDGILSGHVALYPEDGFCKAINQYRTLPAMVLSVHVTDGGLATPLDASYPSSSAWLSGCPSSFTSKAKWAWGGAAVEPSREGPLIMSCAGAATAGGTVVMETTPVATGVG